jgi:hypothetical protein
MKIIYFDEGEFEMQWANLINNPRNIDDQFIAITSFDELNNYLGENTLIYTIPSQFKDWMEEPNDNFKPDVIIVGPNRGKSLSSWLTENMIWVNKCKFKSIGDNVQNAHQIAGKALNIGVDQIG